MSTYEIHIGYLRRYLQEHPDADPLELAQALREVFGLCPWQSEEIAMVVYHGIEVAV